MGKVVHGKKLVRMIMINDGTYRDVKRLARNGKEVLVIVGGTEHVVSGDPYYFRELTRDEKEKIERKIEKHLSGLSGVDRIYSETILLR